MATPTSDPPTENGRVAVVTGAAGGLGRACCELLCRRGMHVVATDVDADAVNTFAGELAAQGASISAATLDASSRPAVDALVGEVVEEWKSLDVVVNLAGVLRNAVLSKIDDDDFHLVFATHVDAALNTMRAAAPVMRANGYGRIVNTSSLAARGSIAGASYGAAKGAVEGLTRSAAMEYAPHGVTINCVAPGLIGAGMFLTVPPEYQEQSAARIPMGRVGEPGEVAACIGFLVSREASYVTGQTLLVCGGLSLGY